MTGWIKFDKDMVDDPRLVRAATALLERYAVSKRSPVGQIELSTGDALRYACNALRGALVTLWRYADEHIRDDDTVTCSVTEIDALVGIEGFCSVMPDDWIVTRDDGKGVALPGYVAKNSLSSKRKKSDKSAERQRRYRERLKASRIRNVVHNETRNVTGDKCVTLGGDQDLLRVREREHAPTPKKRKANDRTKPAKTPIPEDFRLTPDRQGYAEKNLPNVDAFAAMETFRSTAKSKGWEYVDWDQHWQTVVRQWGPNSGHWSSGQYPRKPIESRDKPRDPSDPDDLIHGRRWQ